MFLRVLIYRHFDAGACYWHECGLVALPLAHNCLRDNLDCMTFYTVYPGVELRK